MTAFTLAIVVPKADGYGLVVKCFPSSKLCIQIAKVHRSPIFVTAVSMAGEMPYKHDTYQSADRLKGFIFIRETFLSESDREYK
jgi:hypothetical protein